MQHRALKRSLAREADLHRINEQLNAHNEELWRALDGVTGQAKAMTGRDFQPIGDVVRPIVERVQK